MMAPIQPRFTCIVNARVLTLADGPRPRRGQDLGRLGVIEEASVEIENGVISNITPGDAPAIGTLEGVTIEGDRMTIDARGRVLMPAFVDCHTHACFAGSRLDEWEMKLRGVPYLDILKQGGGIMSTVRATRAASEGELRGLLESRLALMAHSGTLACEVKSGYGLGAEHELKMLRAIRGATAGTGAAPTPTALLGHALDPEQEGFVDRTINETLPAVHTEFPGVPIDAFCEENAWSLKDTVRLLSRARELGHPLRVHTDQFTCRGMVEEAIALGALSVDHLESSPTNVLERLGASRTYGVMLPACGYHLDGRYANAQWFVQSGGALCLASNYNPGSAPTFSMAFVIADAVRRMGLSVGEAIAACTVNPATLLGLTNRGTIAPGQCADLLLLRHTDERMLAFEVDARPIDMILHGGRVLSL